MSTASRRRVRGPPFRSARRKGALAPAAAARVPAPVAPPSRATRASPSDLDGVPERSHSDLSHHPSQLAVGALVPLCLRDHAGTLMQPSARRSIDGRAPSPLSSTFLIGSSFWRHFLRSRAQQLEAGVRRLRCSRGSRERARLARVAILAAPPPQTLGRRRWSASLCWGCGGGSVGRPEPPPSAPHGAESASRARAVAWARATRAICGPCVSVGPGSLCAV